MHQCECQVLAYFEGLVWCENNQKDQGPSSCKCCRPYVVQICLRYAKSVLLAQRKRGLRSLHQVQ